MTAATFTVTPGTQKYTAVPAVSIGGTGVAHATLAGVSPSVISSTIVIDNPGASYTTAPGITFSGGTTSGTGTAPTGTGNATSFQLVGVKMTAAGSGYSSAPTLALSSGTGAASVQLASVTLASTTKIGGSGNITINSPISGTGSAGLNKVGAGTVTLGGACTYTGATTVSAGTLALSGSATLASASSITIVQGAAFDVSGLSSSTFTLGSGATLTASGAGTTLATASTIKGAVGGLVDLGSRPISLTFTPATFDGRPVT